MERRRKTNLYTAQDERFATINRKVHLQVSNAQTLLLRERVYKSVSQLQLHLCATEQCPEIALMDWHLSLIPVLDLLSFLVTSHRQLGTAFPSDVTSLPVDCSFPHCDLYCRSICGQTDSHSLVNFKGKVCNFFGTTQRTHQSQRNLYCAVQFVSASEVRRWSMGSWPAAGEVYGWPEVVYLLIS